MTMPRKNPPAPGKYCDATRTRYPAPCNDPAVWIVFYAHKRTGEKKQKNACGGHLNKLLADLVPEAEYSREMFRVIPWATALAEYDKRTTTTATTA